MKKATISENESLLRKVRENNEPLHRKLDCLLMFGSHLGDEDYTDPGGTAQTVIKAMYDLLPRYARVADRTAEGAR